MKLGRYLFESKVISAAVLMTDGNKFLAVRPTNYKDWELPKGEMEPGENPKKTAAREFFEETGVNIDSSKLKLIGKYNLHKDKDVILYTYKTDKLPPTSSMRCLSYFNARDKKGNLLGMKLPEINGWIYLTPDKIDIFIRKEMKKMIRDIIK